MAVLTSLTCLRPDRRRNKPKEEALGALMKKMILLRIGSRIGFIGSHNHKWGPHCQKRF
jgi:hypothetical protein